MKNETSPPNTSVVRQALKCRYERGLRIAIYDLEKRIGSYEDFVKWPALVESLKKDFDFLKAEYARRHGKEYKHVKLY
jgi:hypothetical protein